jgi:hypothetical protein
MSNTNAIALSWEQAVMTVNDFYDRLTNKSASQIDVDPIGQRPDVESLSKRQGIIDTVIAGYDFGELKLRTLTENLHRLTNFKYRSIDGGHRKRAIRDFIDGKFKTAKHTVAYVNGKIVRVGDLYYKQLPIEVKEQFNNYEIRFTVYDENMTDEQAGETFRRTNITTDVNHQEMLNSYEDNKVAVFIRQISRPISGLSNEYHRLFEYTSLESGDRKQKWFKEASTRLRDDEWVTRILTMIYKQENNNPTWLSASNKDMENIFLELNEVWTLDTVKAKRHQKQVTEALDFILNYAIAKKNASKYGLMKQDFAIISRLYFYMINKYGQKGFKVKSFDALYSGVRSAMDRFVGTDDTNLRTDTWRDDKGLRLVCECFKQYLTVHDDHKRAEQSMIWLLEETGNLEQHGFVSLDTTRLFPTEMIEEKWRKNGRVCDVDGESLELKDAIGAHIIPHCEGGRTTIDNLMVVRKTHNDKMGSMNALVYKEVYLNGDNNRLPQGNVLRKLA